MCYFCLLCLSKENMWVRWSQTWDFLQSGRMFCFGDHHPLLNPWALDVSALGAFVRPTLAVHWFWAFLTLRHHDNCGHPKHVKNLFGQFIFPKRAGLPSPRERREKLFVENTTDFKSFRQFWRRRRPNQISTCCLSAWDSNYFAMPDCTQDGFGKCRRSCLGTADSGWLPVNISSLAVRLRSTRLRPIVRNPFIWLLGELVKGATTWNPLLRHVGR